MNKRANKELFLAKIVIAIALVAIFAAGLWMFIGQDTIAVQSAKEAYSLYMIENPEATDKDFIYIYEDTVIVAIRNGKVVRKEYATEADAVKAALGSKDGANYSLAGTGNGKLFVVKLFEKTDDIYALGTSTLATGAEKLTIKVVSNGMIFATFDIPAEAIDRKQSPVGVTIKKINAEDYITLREDQGGFGYDIDVTNLVENNTARIAITINGPKGLVADANKSPITAYHKDKNIVSTYDSNTGKISFSTTSFSPFTFTWEEFEVKNLAQLRYYLQLPGRVNIKLANSISIDLANGHRHGENQGETFQYTDAEIGVTNETTYYSKGQYAKDSIDWLYFGALVFGEKSLDLNGYTIEHNGNPAANDSALFAVGDNSSFTIRDTYTGADRKGTVKMLFDHYAVWAVNDSSTVNIYGGIFAADKYTGADPVPNRSLVYSSGGEIHVRGGYFLFENTNDDQINGGFNVLNEIDVPRIWIYGGVYLREELYRQNADGESQKETIMLIGGADVEKVNTTLSVVGFESFDGGENDTDKWYTITGQTMQIKDGLNTDKYIYRVGNGNSFKLSAFFKMIGDLPDGGNISVRAVDIIKTRKAIDDLKQSQGYGENGYYSQIATTTQIDTENIGSLDAAIQFKGFTGPVRLELYDSVSGALYASINLEVVDGKNMTTSVISPSSSNMNVCLLNNIETGSTITINNGYTFYGNGFTITDKRTSTPQSAGLMIVYDGTVDNIKLDGYQSTTNSAAIDQNGRAPAMSISGPANVYNSYIQGGRQAILCNTTGNVYLKNVTLDGGSRANMEIMGGNVILEDCTTTIDTTGGLKGLGILVASTSVKLTINGSLTQYNWVKASDLPTTYQSVLSAYFSDSTHSYNSHLNMGIFFMVESVVFTEEQVRTQLFDNTGNDYDYVQESAAGYTATAYLPKKSLGPSTFYADPTQTPAYQGMGNHAIVPDSVFDFTNKNYDSKETDDNVYCFYNSIGYVDISFEKGSSKVWDTNILTATKFGKNLPVSVSMNGTDYTGKSVTFTEAGDYVLTYTCVDPYNYTADGIGYNLYYSKTLNIKVTVVEAEAIVYHPEFIYTDGSSTTQVIANNKTYVMPDVSATSSTIGSTTVGGKTIYYPIVSVGGSNSSGGKYTTGKIYCWSPAFTAINIKDYNKDTGALLYTYDKSMQKWPHNISSTTKVTRGEYFGYTGSPYTGATGDQYNICKYSSTYGLSFVASEIERAVTATTSLVEFYYVGNDGITYYYYIEYNQKKVSYSCVTGDTLVTLADGTKKEIQYVTSEDMLMVWNHYIGKYEAVPAAIIFNHGYGNNTVIKLNFSDGTEVKAINLHQFLDVDLNKYVSIGADNVAEYVGHHFAKRDGNGYTTVTLQSYEVSEEYIEAYGIISALYYNILVEDMFSTDFMPEDYDLFNYFEIGEGLVFDADKMEADIQKYGLYTYEDFADYLTYEQFVGFNVQYFKIPVGKGLYTYEGILNLIDTYLKG